MKSRTVKAILSAALIVAGLGLSACDDGHPGRWSRHHGHDHGHDHDHDGDHDSNHAY
ncbi:hypothetical protein KRR38_11780 [Novosphingobium sp. G106]|uniref:hypothetical protein n=1 Tax=Novosphingobium sp. G106 TaxID=2849500 RepID=UPI001C2CE050|nr:hypothetical protein [Novosphingobium sp. G106]MBV1688337.1 hypothetical protein [Novosphingobium sp. G106]